MSKIRKHNNRSPQTNSRHREDEPWNTNSYKALARQPKQNNQPLPSHKVDCKTRKNNLFCIAKHLTHYDEKKKLARGSHIVRANENLKLSHKGPSQRQASQATYEWKLYLEFVIETHAWTYVVQLRENHSYKLQLCLQTWNSCHIQFSYNVWNGNIFILKP